MADENSSPQDIPPSEGINEKYPFYPNAESYEAEASSLELLIRNLKNDIKKDLQDEFAQLQYLATKLEQELKIALLKIKQLEADNEALRAAQNERIASFDEAQSPKQTFENEDEEYESAGSTSSETEAKINRRNETGKGGLPGSKNASSITINTFEYQGDRVRLEDGSELVWDKTAKQYSLQSSVGNNGLQFTYFAVEAAYLEEGYINPNYPKFYSQTILRKQVWYEKTPRNREEDGIGPKYGGKVPLQVLKDLLNQRVNSAKVLATGDIVEFQDFTKAYVNWRYMYQVGKYFKNAAGDLYAIVEVDERKSKGNAPAFRTDGNLKSSTYGQQVKTKASERASWNSTLSGTGSKRTRKKK